MAAPYPFFAGAGFAGAPVAGAFAGLACGAPVASGPFGAISALIVNKNVCTFRCWSSCFASLISIFWKYPSASAP